MGIMPCEALERGGKHEEKITPIIGKGVAGAEKDKGGQ